VQLAAGPDFGWSSAACRLCAPDSRVYARQTIWYSGWEKKDERARDCLGECSTTDPCIMSSADIRAALQQSDVRPSVEETASLRGHQLCTRVVEALPVQWVQNIANWEAGLSTVTGIWSSTALR
jgi:hypothetical protein